MQARIEEAGVGAGGGCGRRAGHIGMSNALLAEAQMVLGFVTLLAVRLSADVVGHPTHAAEGYATNNLPSLAIF